MSLAALVKCPKGCQDILQLSNIDYHMSSICERAKLANEEEDEAKATCSDCNEILSDEIQLKLLDHNVVCPNTLVSCPFVQAGCDTQLKRCDLSKHLESGILSHMKLLNEKVYKLQVASETCIDHDDHDEDKIESSNGPLASETKKCPLDRGDPQRHSQKLLRDLFQRVVSLEQRNLEQSILLEEAKQSIKILKQSTTDLNNVEGRYCKGKYIWKPKNFWSEIQKMKSNRGYCIYSPGFYTDIPGYKVCLRCNLNLVKDTEFLALKIHVMSGTFEFIKNKVVVLRIF